MVNFAKGLLTGNSYPISRSHPLSKGYDIVFGHRFCGKVNGSAALWAIASDYPLLLNELNGGGLSGPESSCLVPLNTIERAHFNSIVGKAYGVVNSDDHEGLLKILLLNQF